MIWTDTQIHVLKTMRADKCSSSLIGQKIGKTRNAVLGKCHRLGLCVESGKTYQPPHRLRRKPTMRAARVVPQIIAAIEDHAIPIEQRKTFFDLGEHDCRWPVGEVGQPDFFFCGGEAVEGHPYCLGHCGRAFGWPTQASRAA